MRSLAYLAIFLGLSLPVLAATYAATRTWDMDAACDARGYSDDAYLAYCQNEAFGDYEHAAYYRGLEPRAVAAARRADVILLGNSRMQVAFSRPETGAFFASRHLAYHLLGFGYGEMAPFAFQLVHALDLRPKILIVNVDSFFEPLSTPAAALAVRSSWKTRVDFALKAFTQPLHRFLCDRDPNPCPGGAPAVFRSRATGQWIWADARSSPISTPFVPPAPFADSATIRSDAALAETELRETGVRPACIVLTQVPQPSFDYSGLVAAVAARTGTVAVVTRLSGLATFDGSHLDRASGDAWAEAFFRDAAPAIDRCLGTLAEPAT